MSYHNEGIFRLYITCLLLTLLSRSVSLNTEGKEGAPCYSDTDQTVVALSLNAEWDVTCDWDVSEWLHCCPVCFWYDKSWGCLLGEVMVFRRCIAKIVLVLGG